ncbi:MAG TPA: glutathione synthase, partial [Plasticicumulans sp.]|nr:glutathione synthase [Plasticicumulans sp.]
MNKRLGVVMDPIATITIKKDTTFAILLAAQARGWSIRYFEQSDLYLRDGRACGRARALTVRDDRQDWYSLGEPQDEPLAGLDV